MATIDHISNQGGFLSPPPSSLASSAAAASQSLPRPRSSPLKAGGAKESTFIRYVDGQLLHIQRRFAKRSTPQQTITTLQLAQNTIDPYANLPPADDWDDVKGYANIGEACDELEELVNVIWVSGTPSLQVPYLISMALLVSQLVAAMPVGGNGGKKLFRCLGKLDRCFSSLIQGRDVEIGDALPGFGFGKCVSGTEKVRIRSLVERTRISVMEAFKSAEFEHFEEPEEDRDGGLVLENEEDLGEEEEEEDDSWDMLIARVYDRTVQELGDSLPAPDIGIITEGRLRSN
ncbi:hypothetical protein K431DRAFT_224320 [Polychaeton citri CBS 116435]|uniref:Uncharacterized protein n=1 Tax=Polychaeton citri CBS 116435 TaxID=1314669 RepID=A0A9P4UQT0_9PEZI|nr:hypothetical protein K431DRAFT_224320 [Polychaeton citri CBS 116435]